MVWSVVVMFETWWDISEGKWGCRWSVVSALRIPGSWSRAYCWCLSSLGLRCMCVASEWLANRAHARNKRYKEGKPAKHRNADCPMVSLVVVMSGTALHFRGRTRFSRDIKALYILVVTKTRAVAAVLVMTRSICNALHWLEGKWRVLTLREAVEAVTSQ